MNTMGKKTYNIHCNINELFSSRVTEQLDSKDKNIYLILIEVYNIANYVQSTYFKCIEVGDSKYNLFIRKVANYLKIRFTKSTDKIINEI